MKITLKEISALVSLLNDIAKKESMNVEFQHVGLKGKVTNGFGGIDINMVTTDAYYSKGAKKMTNEFRELVEETINRVMKDKLQYPTACCNYWEWLLCPKEIAKKAEDKKIIIPSYKPLYHKSKF